MLREELTNVLDSSDGERAAMRFLAAYPDIVRWAFCRTGGHSTYVVKEFPFGSRHRSDFVVATSYSGAWEVHMIELEPPDDLVITKDGVASHRLNKAISQVHDWAKYIEQSPADFRKDLAHWCEKRDLLGKYGNNGRPCNYTGDYLDHPDTHIWYHYHIVIGRRESIDRDIRRKMNQYSGGMLLLRVCTYGRFQDIAGNFDRLKKGGQVCLTDTKEDA